MQKCAKEIRDYWRGGGGGGGVKCEHMDVMVFNTAHAHVFDDMLIQYMYSATHIYPCFVLCIFYPFKLVQILLLPLIIVMCQFKFLYTCMY